MLKAMEKEIEKRRRTWLAWEKKRDASFQLPETVMELQNISVSARPIDVVDIFRPKNGPEKLPVIVNIHGGGLVMGTKNLNRGICAQLCSFGFLVIAIEYPLVPETDVFGQLQSVARTLDALQQAIPSFGGDVDHVSLTGDSAGAFLSLHTVLCQKNQKAAEAAEVTPTTLPVKALGLNSGLFYPTKVASDGLFLMRDSFFGKGWRKHPYAPYLNPENPEILEILPPCFLSTAAGDFLRGHTVNYAICLEEAGKRCELLDLPDKLEHAFNALYPQWEGSRLVNEQMAEFLRNC